MGWDCWWQIWVFVFMYKGWSVFDLLNARSVEMEMIVKVMMVKGPLHSN